MLRSDSALWSLNDASRSTRIDVQLHIKHAFERQQLPDVLRIGRRERRPRDQHGGLRSVVGERSRSSGSSFEIFNQVWRPLRK